MSVMHSPYHVRAVHCDHMASDEEIYQALKRAVDPLTTAWDRLSRAKRIGIKFNQDKRPMQRVYYKGHLQQLVSEQVARAFLRILRERTTADLVCIDVSAYTMYWGVTVEETTTFAPLLAEFGVEYANGIVPPHRTVRVPGGGQMFAQYLLPTPAVDVDEFVSVSLLKNHAFMGVTLALKNLFGLMPGLPPAPARQYYHHLVRMPYMLADLGRIFNPILNVLDGLVGQAGCEWGNGREDGPPRIGNTLVAGDQVIATDACAAYLMGHDPQSDWLTPPFHRDRNSLLVAAEAGFGTVDLAEIDFQTEVTAPVNDFFANLTDSTATVISWRRTTAEQAIYYRDNRERFVRKYAGQYILLQEGEVRWHDDVSLLRESRRKLSGANPDQAMWLKYVDPDEVEGEHFEVYERVLTDMKDLPMPAAQQSNGGGKPQSAGAKLFQPVISALRKASGSA